MNIVLITTLAFNLSALMPPATPQDANASGKVGTFHLDASTKASTLEDLIKEMNGQYIAPDVAKKIEASLRAWMSTSEYSGLEDPKEFATKVNDLLKKEVTDAHLRFRYSENPLPKRQRPTEPSKEELKRFNEETRFRNSGFEKVERLRGNVGYIDLVGFWSPKDMERPMEGTMKFLSNVDAMIVDLRRNGGGDPAGVQLFCSYFFDSKPVHLNDIFFRDGDKITKTEYWTLKKLAGPRLPNVPVYVLTGKRTASGGEECAYDFQQLKRGVIVGESTWGGANPGSSVRLGDHFTCFIPVGRACNPYTKTNWEGAGIQPDIKVEAAKALHEAHVMALKNLIDTAKDDSRREDLKGILDEVVKGS